MNDKEYEELALEIIDMLGVAFHFAGAKSQHIKELIDIYINEVDNMSDNEEFTQAIIITIINNIKIKYPQYFE